MELAEVTQNPSQTIIYRYRVGAPSRRLSFLLRSPLYLSCFQVVHAASLGDRATVLSKSKDLKFLTGFEAKVRALGLFCSVPLLVCTGATGA